MDLAEEEKLLDDLRANAKERTLRDKLVQDKQEKAAVRYICISLYIVVFIVYIVCAHICISIYVCGGMG